MQPGGIRDGCPVPFSQRRQDTGLVHVADHRENMLPPNVVKMLEKAALQLGTAFQRAWAESKLRESEERRQISHATHIGMFDWDVLKGEIVGRYSMRRSLVFFLPIVHPELKGTGRMGCTRRPLG